MSGSICPNIDIFDRLISANQCISRALLKLIVKDKSHCEDEDVRKWPSKIHPIFCLQMNVLMVAPPSQQETARSLAYILAPRFLLPPCHTSPLCLSWRKACSVNCSPEISAYQDLHLPSTPIKPFWLLTIKPERYCVLTKKNWIYSIPARAYPVNVFYLIFFRFCQQMSKPANCLSAPPVT